MNRKTKYYLIFTGYSLVLTVLVSIISKEIIDPIKILAMVIGPHIMYWFIVGGIRLQLKVISFANVGIYYFLNFIKIFRIVFLIIGSVIMVIFPIIGLINSKHILIGASAVGASFLLAGITLRKNIELIEKSV